MRDSPGARWGQVHGMVRGRHLTIHSSRRLRRGLTQGVRPLREYRTNRLCGTCWCLCGLVHSSSRTSSGPPAQELVLLGSFLDWHYRRIRRLATASGIYDGRSISIPSTQLRDTIAGSFLASLHCTFWHDKRVGCSRLGRPYFTGQKGLTNHSSRRLRRGLTQGVRRHTRATRAYEREHESHTHPLGLPLRRCCNVPLWRLPNRYLRTGLSD